MGIQGTPNMGMVIFAAIIIRLHSSSTPSAYLPSAVLAL